MYRGFKLESLLTAKEIIDYQVEGRQIFARQADQAVAFLNKIISEGGTLDGTAIQDFWFPQIKADIFISHSHKNEPEVIALAGFLWKRFGLQSFIDSCIWSSAYDLQKVLDNTYSWSDDKKETYDYLKVSNSSSHVHMMLSTALSMMIDKTECIFFYKTPNSIQSYKEIEKTSSPWIYSEISTTQIVRKKIPSRLKRIDETRYFSKGGVLNEGLKIDYKVSLNHLSSVTRADFEEWKATNGQGLNALDYLYNIIVPKGLTLLK